MTEKQFKVHAEEYQDTDDMGYAIAPPVIYYHVGNSKIGFNFDTEKEAKMLCEAWNKLVEENEQSKMMIATLRNIVLENEDLEKENKELKDFKEKVFDLIDENIKYYRKYSTLTVKMPMDCKYRKSCLDNHSINVGNKAKENAYQKLKKELSE